MNSFRKAIDNLRFFPKIGLIFFSFLSFIIIGIIAYILGFDSIVHHPGNDALNALSYIVYLNKYFPHIPLWFPYQGGGMSIALGYPQLYSFTVILLSKLTGLSFMSAMSVINFLAILLPAWGVYLFVVTRFKSFTAALIAGILFLISPMPYYWIWRQGFLAQTFSVIFVPFYLIFFDWFIDSLLKDKTSILALILLSFLGTLTFLGHPVTMLGVFAFSGLYVFSRIIFGQEATFKKRFIRGFLGLFISAISTLGLSAFAFLPMQVYLNFASRDIKPTIDLTTLPAFEWKGILNLYKPSFRYLQYEDAAIAPAVWILATFGALLGFFRDRKVFSLGLLTIASLYIMGSFTVWSVLARVSFFVANFFTVRTFYPIAVVIAPIAASMAIVTFINILQIPIIKFERKLSLFTLKLLTKSARVIFFTLITIAIALIAIFNLQKISGFYDSDYPYDSAFGPSMVIKGENVEKGMGCLDSVKKFISSKLCYYSPQGILKEIKKETSSSLHFGKDNPPQELAGLDYPEDKKEIITGETHRIDVSHFLGAMVKAWKIENDSEMLNAYTGQASLIKSYYTIFSLSFDNVKNNPNPSAQTLYSLGNYFGTEAVIEDSLESSMGAFKNAGWQRYGDRTSVLFPPFKTGLVSIGNIPRVLVIGSKDKEAYKLVFRDAISGALPFDKGVLVFGSEKIGDMSPKEISSYDLVVLQGYGYKKRAEDLNMLKEYVNSGGSVFIDTGWQYVSPDWGRNKNGNSFTTDFPDPFPVETTTWDGIGKDWSGASLDSQFSKDASVNNFGPLTWNDQDWSLAFANEARPWAKPILTKDGKILIAGGQYGKGKIVWSGFNIFAHMEDKKSNEEAKFLANIFEYLQLKSFKDDQSGFSLLRDYPDRLTINIQNSISSGESLYFREAYYPSWKAYAISNGQKIPLKINVAGPQFMLISLPGLIVGDKVVFEFGWPIELKVGILISILTIFIFVLLLLNTTIFKNRLIHSVLGNLQRLLPRNHVSEFKLFKSEPKDFSSEEEDY